MVVRVPRLELYVCECDLVTANVESLARRTDVQPSPARVHATLA